MRKAKKRFRYERHVKVERLQGISMSLPEEVPTPTSQREEESVALLWCPMCGATRYVTRRFLDVQAEMKRVIVEGVPPDLKEMAEHVQTLPRHIPCDTIFHVKMLKEESKDG